MLAAMRARCITIPSWTSGEASMNRWRVVVGGVSMNLALGSLYAWSVFVAPLEKEFDWKRTQTSLAYTIAIVTFAASFMLAGRLQDKYGPRLCAFLGTVLVSLGFFLTSLTDVAHVSVFGVWPRRGRSRKRVRLRHTDAGGIQVVSRQARPDRRDHGGGLWRQRVHPGAVRPRSDRVDRLARDSQDPGRRVFRYGNGRRVAVDKPPARVPS